MPQSRRVLLIQGQVQGVGFRPFIHSLANRVGLFGFVRNDGGSVRIEVEGAESVLEAFLAELRLNPPAGSRIDFIECNPAPVRGDLEFTIFPSQTELGMAPLIPVDVTVCQDCLRELFDPTDRRYEYPFLSCSQCGPRLTIIGQAPYDRIRTSLDRFTLCLECREEYLNPRDRRFHAESIACPVCGPQLVLRDTFGQALQVNDLIGTAADAIRCGKIVAVKGIGGYHLACDATIESAVQRLRQQKQRDARPLAVMVRDLAAARRLCHVSSEEADQLQSRASPIVLLRRLTDARRVVAESVAGQSSDLGLMLPYTPLHHLLLARVADSPLVMTSGNVSDEPIVFEDDVVLQQLSRMADLFLTNDRPIIIRCDDSVVRVIDQQVLPIRRSRGFVPDSIELPMTCTNPILAVGGQQKVTIALAHDRHCFLSHHLGDLDQLQSFRAFETAIEHYCKLLNVLPATIVHDLHPSYESTRYAQLRSAASANRSLQRVAVQHHHAHLASCLAEHGRNDTAIGVVFDGTGFGTDGAVWGGEFLVGDCATFRRAAHLRYVPLPGASRAIHQPWRIALAYLIEAGIDWIPDWKDVTASEAQGVRQIIASRFNSPPTSSAGRLFDAVAALMNQRTHAQYEGQPAIELEWQAHQGMSDAPYRFDIVDRAETETDAPMIIDTRPLIAGIVRDLQDLCPNSIIARRFHATLVAMIADVCERIRERTGIQVVALSGGCFLNALLMSASVNQLQSRGFEVLRHRIVPPSDAGLSLGQAAIACARQNSIPAPWRPSKKRG